MNNSKNRTDDAEMIEVELPEHIASWLENPKNLTKLQEHIRKTTPS